MDQRGQRGLVLAAGAAALLLAMTVATGTVRGGGETVTLDPAVDSTLWKPGVCGVVGAGLVEWEFELDGVSPGLTSALSLSVTFQNDGLMGPIASTWDAPGTTHTFIVTTTGHDIATAASVSVPNSAGELTVQSICVGPAPTPEASLQNAAMSRSQATAPTLAFFGLLLAALGGLATLRVARTRAER
jgi:hypothetical protein